MVVDLSNGNLIADPSFTPVETASYELCLQCSVNATSCSIFDHEQQKYIAVGSFMNPPEKVISGHSWMLGNFRKVRIILETRGMSLVPALFFDPEVTESYLRLTTEFAADEKVRFDRLSAMDLVNVFNVPSSLIGQIEKLFPSASVHHLSTSLISALTMLYKNQFEPEKVFLNLRKDQFDLLVFNEQGPLYCNAFSYAVPEDVAYYLIFVMEQLSLNPENVSLVLYGEIEKHSPLFDLLYKYIRNIGFGRRNENAGYSGVFREIPSHRFFSVLNPEP
jgi:hypothetical protein